MVETHHMLRDAAELTDGLADVRIQQDNLLAMGAMVWGMSLVMSPSESWCPSELCIEDECVEAIGRYDVVSYPSVKSPLVLASPCTHAVVPFLIFFLFF